jgi:CHAT domain-containing protein
VVLSYAPSARALGRAIRLAETAGTRSLMAIQDPRPAPGPPLPFAAVEVAAARALWPEAVILPGAQATRAAVLAALPDSDVIHFACHGRADITDPQAGGLGLASGDLLTPGDLAGLSLRARLVVLSACETGVPGMDVPDEVVGLPTALLQAGVAGTVASLWEVTDAGAALTMVEFYRQWRLGAHPPAAALREAQRWLRDSTAGTIRQTFESMLDGNGWLPAGEARSCWQQVVLADPDARPFAEPVSWAAFAYSGS